MSRINAIRLININYNHNSYCINDETMYLNSESTLLSLQNGGGKSVLIQMLTAPFVHKKYRNVKDRPFSSYFTTNRPSFILVEWALDTEIGYVLTGMMVRKNQNSDDKNDEELEMINFISEYKEPCLQDIHSLPVIEVNDDERTLKSFSYCRQLFESFKKDSRIPFSCFDMTNSHQSKQYFDQLLEYRINFKEWENIIRKVNEEESGLSKLFVDCKDEKGLIEKWFLEIIENKLNKDGSRIKNFQDLLEKYIESYRSNETSIQRKAAMESFEVEAQKIKSAAENYKKACDDSEMQQQQIAGFLHEIERLHDLAEQEARQENAIADELDRQIQRLIYTEFSAEYYGFQDKLEKLAAQLEELDKIKNEHEESHKEWTYKLHCLECAKKQQKVDEENQNAITASERLDLCRKENQDLQPEREYLGYVLRKYYESEVQKATYALEDIRREKNAVAEEKEEINHRKDVLQKDEIKCSSEISALGTEIKGYDRQEISYNKRFKPVLSRNILGEYEPGLLNTTSERLEMESLSAIKERKDTLKRSDMVKQEIENHERDIRDLDSEKDIVSEELFKLNALHEKHEAELAARRKILVYLEMKEAEIFETDCIIKTASNKIRDLQNLIGKLTTEEQEIRSRISNLRTGKTVKLSPEQKKMFDGLGIQVIYALEWMKRKEFTEEQKLNLIDKHPFLPYALIMTKREMERLMAEENGAFTSFPIPIITRESLDSEAVSGVQDISTFANAHVHFYMLYNKNLLNEEKLQLLIQELEVKADKIKSECDIRQKELEQFINWKRTVELHSITRLSYESTCANLETARKRVEEIKALILEKRKEKSDFEKELRNLSSEVMRLENRYKNLQQQISVLSELQGAYVEYLENKKKREEFEKRMISIGEAKSSLSEQEINLNGKQIQIAQKEVELRTAFTSVNNELSKFTMYAESIRPEGIDDALLAEITHVMAKFTAITQNISGQLSDLEAQYRLAMKRFEDAKKDLLHEAKRHNLVESDWIEESFAEYKQDEADHKIKNLERIIKDVEKKISNLNIEATRFRTNSENTISKIKNSCSFPGPMPREEIRIVDFRQQKQDLQFQREEHHKEAKTQGQRVTLYDSTINGLSEFQFIKLIEPVTWQEDFRSYGMGELRLFAGNLKSRYNAAKGQISGTKGELEKVLNKVVRMDEFKDEFFKRSLELLLEVTDNADDTLKQLDILLKSFHTQMEKLLIDIQIIDKNKAELIAQLIQYVSDVHAQMDMIDTNSSITIHERTVKMLKISIPDWENNLNLYKARLSDLVETLTRKCVGMLKKNESIHEYIGKCITTRELYDTTVGIGNVNIQLHKVEAQREIPISWNEVARNSGGEGFLSAFVVLSSLLYYMRRDESDIFAQKNEGKVLLMDNPFAQTNAEHLLKPLMDMAKKNNTQLICLTGLGGESIYNRFDNIYVLNLIASSLNNVQYLKGQHRVGKEPERLSFTHIDVTSEEQLELLF